LPTVRSEDHPGGVRVLTLDRPPANAIDETLLRELLEAALVAKHDDAVRAVVLTGAGKFFSGGFDLRAPRRDDDESRRIAELYRDSHVALFTLPKPTLAMVRGHAIAGGFVLALACDYRLGAAGDYRIGMNEVAIGASFPRAAIEIVKLRLSHARAAELVLGASVYPAEQAVRLGLVDELLPADQIEATVLRRAARFGAYPRESYAHTKAALLHAAIERIRAETPEQADEATGVWTTDESRAARHRQQEKLRGG